jgi:hypothetical protein
VRLSACVLSVAACLWGAPAFADGAGRAPLQPGVAGGSPAHFLHSHATCRTASDGCRICTRTAEGIACSTAGFACVAAAWTCNENDAGTPR